MQVQLTTLKPQWIASPMSPPAPLDAWSHVAATYDGTTLRLYRDGQEVGSGMYPGSMMQCAPGGVAVAVGSDELNQKRFAGLIDEVRVFDHALTGAEVRSLLYTGSDPALVLPFEDPILADGNPVVDASGWGRDGTLHAFTGDIANKAVPGQVGSYAISFDGTSDNVQVASFGVFTKTTVSAWVYRRTGAPTARETIVSYKEKTGCGLVLALEGQVPKLYANVAGTWRSITDGANQVSPNQWVHLAGTYDGSTMRLYRNGVEVKSAVYAGSMKNDCADTTAIGSRNSNNQHWFPGAIDEVRIYPRALPAEVAS
jgi:hypothetical protein